MRFSTQICPADAPPPAKRLRTVCTGDGPFAVSPSTSAESWSPVHSPPNEQMTGHSLSEDKQISAFLDLDILDCNVCMEPLSAPIFQCCNGHYSCRECITRMGFKCPACSESTGKIRNLGLEKIIESLRMRCKFSNQGCTDLLTLGLKRLHEHRCLFSPYHCPAAQCRFHGPLKDFSNHFKDAHKSQTMQFSFDTRFTLSLTSDDKYVLLQTEDIYFLFCICEETLGKRVHISSFYDPNMGWTSSSGAYTYFLEAKCGKRHLSMASSIQSYSDLNLIDFLLIPRRFFASEGVFQLEVSISCPRRTVDEYLVS